MTRTRTLHRWTLAALSAAALTLTIAQVAQADPGWRRWRHADHGRWGGPERRVVFRDGGRGGAGPALAGLIGGFVLGTMVHPQPVVVRERVVYEAPPVVHYREQYDYAPPAPQYREQDDYAPPAPQYREQDQGTPPAPQYREPDQGAPAGRYRYEDISGERWWDTLDEARQAATGRDGPKAIRIVDSRDDHVVDTLYWKHDHFVSDNGDRDSGRGNDNRGN